MHPIPSAKTRDEVRAFWAGPRLSPYEELSLLSFIATGARVLLYSNDMTLRVPGGVELIDVNELLPQQTRSFAYEDGDRCLTPHSDLFRYTAVERFGGWYFDLDIVCIQDKLPQSKIYIARESDDLVNAAVMKFPAQSPILTAAIDETRRLWPTAGRLTIGPELFTRLTGEFALDHLVRPRSSAYEIGTTDILSMFDPDAREQLEERVAQSDFVHLWNEIWRRIRIPKAYGPPEGCFLDGLFRRFDLHFTIDARLTLEALETWLRERHVLSQLAARLDTEVVPDNAFGLLIQQLRQRGVSPFVIHRPETSPRKERRKATDPQTVRTLWHGPSIGAYQLMCLRSFVDRGHRVEVFSYDAALELPRWLTRRNASEILDPNRVIRYLTEQERFAVHANLFRYALLHQLGGWWIDPDVVLLGDELPTDALFISGPNEFNVVSTSAMKFPAGDPILADALRRIAPLEQPVSDWDQLSAPVLTQALSSRESASLARPDMVNPISWFDVLSFFNPAQADEVAQQCAEQPFLGLHYDAWLRAGIPVYLGPPPGSFLDRLFNQHKIGFQFAEHMEFADVRRWVAHMYQSLRLQNGAANT
jgi:mannosyltransferase OCH1-like enzyme